MGFELEQTEIELASVKVPSSIEYFGTGGVKAAQMHSSDFGFAAILILILIFRELRKGRCDLLVTFFGTLSRPRSMLAFNRPIDQIR